MKLKDIKRCHHINLSTSPSDIVKTMSLEFPIVKYNFLKNYGGKNKYERFKESMFKQALETKQSNVTDVGEYVSHKGNRWVFYLYTEYFEKANYAVQFETSFIYYETCGSCGAFFPTALKDQNNNDIQIINGAIVFTSHFFQRLSERTGKAYCSRELIQEFMTTKQTQAVQADCDGDIIIKFKGGYGFGKQTNTKPTILEVRTFLSDKQLSNKQRLKCESINAYANLLADGMCFDEIRALTVINSSLSEEEKLGMAERNLSSIIELGLEKHFLLLNAVQIIFLQVLCELLHMNMNKLTTQQCALINAMTQACYSDFISKYVNFKSSEASEKENEAFVDDLISAMACSARVMGFRSITKEKITFLVKCGKILY